MPAGLKGPAKKLYKAVCIKPAGAWSADLLESTDIGRILALKHWENVKKELLKAKPKTKEEWSKVLKKAVMTPQQRLLILYEKGLCEPLSAQEFHEYLKLFKENFPERYEKLYGKKTPAQIVADCFKPLLQRKA